MSVTIARADAMAELAASRPARPRIEPARLEAFLRAQPDVRELRRLGPLHYIEDGGGSNGIALFEADLETTSESGVQKFVLRYAPGEQLLKQKRFDEEFLTLRAVSAAGIPAPRARWFEPTGAAIGYPFLIMEQLDGRAPSNRMMYSVGLLSEVSPAERKVMLLDAAGFHGRLRAAAIGPEAVPHLIGRGVGSTDIERELSWWLGEARLVTEPGDPRRRYLEELNRWMVANQPAARPGTLVHGDAQIANLMFKDGRFQAALDWELSYIGHNESDLALVVMLVRQHVPPGERVEGIPTEAEILARYEAEAGVPVEHWAFFNLFNLLKVSTIMLMSSRHMDAAGADMMWQLNAKDRETAWALAKQEAAARG